MLRHALRSLVILPLLTLACGPDDDERATACGELEARNLDELVLCNGLDDAVLARVELPDGPAPPGGWPGIVLLHGSSGLFRPAKVGCSEELHGRFAEWGELLTQRGFAVIMPASFMSRGYCDGYEAGPDEDDEERLVDRAFDAAAAANWLCADRRIDCARLGVLGFSNGGSVAMLVMHEDLGDAEDPRLHSLTMPRLAAGVAYYPGCGLDRQLATRLDDELFDRYFFPTGRMWIPHAGKDPLVDDCKELRDPQVKAVAIDRGIKKDWFQLEIYGGATHGFDVWEQGDPYVNRNARDDAQVLTLAKLERWLERK